MTYTAALVLALGILAAPLTAEAQPAGKAPARVGYLGNSYPSTVAPSVEAFRKVLRDLGWIEGQSLVIEYRWAEGNPDGLPALAAELVRLKVDVIALSGSLALRAAQQATSTIPIVIGVLLIDPVDAGFVASLPRPGGNITGACLPVRGDRHQAGPAPCRGRARALPAGRPPPRGMPQGTDRAAAAAADTLGLKARMLEVSEVATYEGAFRTARDDRARPYSCSLAPSSTRTGAR